MELPTGVGHNWMENMQVLQEETPKHIDIYRTSLRVEMRCIACKSEHIIESDDDRLINKGQKEFIKKHIKCKEKFNGRQEKLGSDTVQGTPGNKDTLGEKVGKRRGRVPNVRAEKGKSDTRRDGGNRKVRRRK